MIRHGFVAVLMGYLLASAPVSGEEPARLAGPAPSIVGVDDGMRISFDLSNAVPFRVAHLQDPPRLTIDFSGLDVSAVDPKAIANIPFVVDGAAGRISAELSRVVLQFEQPYVMARSRVDPADGGVQLTLWLKAVTAEELADVATSQSALAGVFAAPTLAPSSITRQDGTRPLRIMLDPGHGGIDPGALRGGQVEADLMLIFSKELRDQLLADGQEVYLTRETDVYVSLERRVAIAQRYRADLLLSLHADALDNGEASGATVYTISEKASDNLSRLLVQRQNRAEILAGVDLNAQDDQIADILSDLARQNTLPRANALADALVAGLGESVGGLHKQPRLEASFSVLKAAEIPSVLLELGFISNDGDLARLMDATWRAQAQIGIVKAIKAWAKTDAEQAAQLRR